MSPIPPRRDPELPADDLLHDLAAQADPEIPVALRQQLLGEAHRQLLRVEKRSPNQWRYAAGLGMAAVLALFLVLPRLSSVPTSRGPAATPASRMAQASPPTVAPDPVGERIQAPEEAPQYAAQSAVPGAQYLLTPTRWAGAPVGVLPEGQQFRFRSWRIWPVFTPPQLKGLMALEARRGGSHVRRLSGSELDSLQRHPESAYDLMAQDVAMGGLCQDAQCSAEQQALTQAAVALAARRQGHIDFIGHQDQPRH